MKEKFEVCPSCNSKIEDAIIHENEKLKAKIVEYEKEEKLFDERMEKLNIPQEYVGYDNAQTIKKLLEKIASLEKEADIHFEARERYAAKIARLELENKEYKETYEK